LACRLWAAFDTTWQAPCCRAAPCWSTTIADIASRASSRPRACTSQGRGSTERRSGRRRPPPPGRRPVARRV